jgi:CheY-like chemotaxis protein
LPISFGVERSVRRANLKLVGTNIAESIPGSERSRPAFLLSDLSRVLIVDDQSDATRVLAMLLNRSGYEARALNDSRQALQAVRDFKPHVMLLDIAMPYMNGYEVARRIRRESGFEDLPIIAVTAFGHEEHQKRAQEAGIQHRLVKPCSFFELKALIAQVLSAPSR